MLHGADLFRVLTETATDHLLRRAREYENQFTDEDHPAAGPAVMYRWREVSHFPVDKLAVHASPEEWSAWLDREHADATHDGAEDRYAGLVATKTITDPITVVLGQDRKYYLWDGNHRVAAAFKNGIKTVPALVGTPKQQPAQGKRLTITGDLGGVHAQ